MDHNQKICHRLSVGLKLALQNIAVEIQTFGIFGNHGFMIELLKKLTYINFLEEINIA